MAGSSDDHDTPPQPGEVGTVMMGAEPAPGTQRPAPRLAPSAFVVDGRYRVEHEIGRGGMGIVYLARDAWLDRPVALKVIAPTRLNDHDAAHSFHNEAKALASVRSQHIVQVYAFGVHDGSYYFAMEYVRGRSLRAILSEHEEHGELVPIHRALTVIAQIAEGLDLVHRAGIVHRDVKPANILIEDDTGRPVLADFGLAEQGGASSARRVAGTPRYMPPEQLRGDAALTPQADVYALGCTAFMLLTGRPPFDDANQDDLVQSIFNKPAPRVSHVRSGRAAFDEAIARALQKDPKDRQESSIALAAALIQAGGRSGTKGRISTMALEPAARSDGILRVLVVDDDPVSRKFAIAAVQLACSLQVAVSSAVSGVEALARAELELPDLIILDYEMPGLDGVETLSRLRSLPGGSRLRVLVLSGHVAEQEHWRFSVLGVRDFAAKPIDFRHLVERLEDVVGRLGFRRRRAGQPT